MIQYTPINIKTWSRLGSCGAFGIAAMELPEIDENIMITTADLCFYSGLERFRTKYEDRLINVGIAEQNMIGIAAGMAKEGLNVFATTYATFASTRCADQVRVNMGYMQLPIRLVGLTAGLSVGVLGATHMSFEDVAVLRSIPTMVIYDAVDSLQLGQAIEQIMDYPGPVYIRTPRKSAKPVFDENYQFKLFQSDVVTPGTDITILATGIIVAEEKEAVQKLSKEGISAELISVNTIKPLDEATILQSIQKTKHVVTCENHNIIGGLYSAVSELLCAQYPLKITGIGVKDRFGQVGKYNDLLKEYQLTSDDIYTAVKQNLNK